MTSDAHERIKPIEVATAVLLSIAGLLTSWSSYQAALWDGRQAAAYSRANIIRVQASTASLEGSARLAVDVNLFNAWLLAKTSGKTRLADFYSARFPPELKGPFDAWIKTDPLDNVSSTSTPFENGRVRPPQQELARQLNADGERTYEAGLRAKQISDTFAQATVYFAMSLFFGGIGQVFRGTLVRVGLLAVSAAACSVAISTLVGLPALRPG